MHRLFWKEWRRQRFVLVGGALFMLAGPLAMAALRTAITGRSAFASDAVLLLGVLYPIAFWPLASLAAAVVAATAERGDESWSFLLSRPVTRARLWSAKLLAALATTLLLVGFNELLLLLISSPEAASLPSWAAVDLVGTGGERLRSLALLGAPGAICLGLGLGLVLGLQTADPLRAAGAGALLGGGLITALAYGRTRLDYIPQVEAGQMTVDLVVLSCMAVLASLLLLRRGELMRGSRFLWRSGAIASALGLLSVVSVCLHLAWDARLPGDAAVLSDLRAAGGRVVVSAAREDGLASRVVLSAGPDDDRLRRVSPRLSHSGMPSFDGRSVYYYSDAASRPLALAGAFLSTDGSTLRGHDAASGTDRLLALMTSSADLHAPGPRPSPSGDWVAIGGHGRPGLRIVGIGNGRLPATVQACGSAAWTFWDTLREQLVGLCYIAQPRATLLYWIDPVSGDIVHEQDVGWPILADVQLSSDPARIAFRVRSTTSGSGGSRRLAVLDLRSRVIETIDPADDASVVDAAVAPGVMVWVDQEIRDPESARLAPTARVLVRRDGAMAPTVVATLDGAVVSMALDPEGEWIILGRYEVTDDSSAASRSRVLHRFAMSLDGAHRVDLPSIPSVVPGLSGNVAWVGSHVVAFLAQPATTSPPSNEWFRELHTLDLETGEQRLLWPAR